MRFAIILNCVTRTDLAIAISFMYLEQLFADSQVVNGAGKTSVEDDTEP